MITSSGWIIIGTFLVWNISIASEIPNIWIQFWYAHIWHEIHIFQLALKCAWLVISNVGHIIRYQETYIFQRALSNFSHILSLKRWIVTIKTRLRSSAGPSAPRKWKSYYEQVEFILVQVSFSNYILNLWKVITKGLCPVWLAPLARDLGKTSLWILLQRSWFGFGIHFTSNFFFKLTSESLKSHHNKYVTTVGSLRVS